MAKDIVVDAGRLQRAIEAIVARGGSEPREAALVAENLVTANLTGHDSHGVGMIPRYVDAVLEGGLAVNEHPEIKLDTGVMLRLDGRKGYGQVIGLESMALGIERARKHGTCIVALGNAHHLGRIGHWAEQCVGAGLVSLHFVNVISRPIVAPWGGRDPRFGTNPVCIGVPRAREAAVPARLRDQPHRAGQDARRAQPGQAARARHDHRRQGRPDDQPALHRDPALRRDPAVRRAQGLRPGGGGGATRRRARRGRGPELRRRGQAAGAERHADDHHRPAAARRRRAASGARPKRSSNGVSRRRPAPTSTG